MLMASENNTGIITGARGITLLLCCLVLLVCTVLECCFVVLGLMGTPEHPSIAITAFYWSLAPFAVTALVYLKWPLVTLVVGWIVLFLSTYVAFRYFHEERDLTWYVYQHSLELGYIAASHIGYFAALKDKHKQTRMQLHSLAN